MIAVKIYIYYYFFGKMKFWKIEILEIWKIWKIFKFIKNEYRKYIFSKFN